MSSELSKGIDGNVATTLFLFISQSQIKEKNFQGKVHWRAFHNIDEQRSAFILKRHDRHRDQKNLKFLCFCIHESRFFPAITNGKIVSFRRDREENKQTQRNAWQGEGRMLWTIAYLWHRSCLSAVALALWPDFIRFAITSQRLKSKVFHFPLHLTLSCIHS